MAFTYNVLKTSQAGVKFFQNSFQNRFWLRKLKKNQKFFGFCFFLQTLSFEFSQKFLFVLQKNFKNSFRNRFEIVFEKIAKSPKNSALASGSKGLLPIRPKSNSAGLIFFPKNHFQTCFFNKIKVEVPGRKGVLPIKPKSDFATKRNFFKTRFKTVFDKKFEKKSELFWVLLFLQNFGVLSFLKNFSSNSKKNFEILFKNGFEIVFEKFPKVKHR